MSETAPGILYAATIRLPTEKAHGAQIMHMCAAFAQAGVPVELVIPGRKTAIQSDPFEYYGIARSFSIKTLTAPDFFFLGRLGFLISSVLFALRVRRYAHASNTTVYSRDKVVLLVLAWLGSKNLMWEVHGKEPAWIVRKLAKSVRIVAITEGVKEYLVLHGAQEKNVCIAHDGVDLDAFAHPESREAARKRLGLPQDKKIAMYIGRLDGWKGTDTLFKAAQFLPSNVLVSVIGGEEEQVMRLSALYPSVRFLGYKPYRELANNQAAADVLVLPNTAHDATSRHYTSPLKLFSYMASNRPIIASDLPSLREVLTEQEAYLVTADDPQALAEGVKAALNDSHAVQKAEAAHKKVSRYSWLARAQNIIAFRNTHGAVRDNTYYNSESTVYSAKRYPQVPENYVQYFFTHRRDLMLSLMRTVIENTEAPRSLLEIGCADGILLRSIESRYPDAYSHMLGVDLSHEMVAVAQQHTQSPSISYVQRDSLSEEGFTCAMEIGVAALAIATQEELAYLSRHVVKGGYLLCGFAGRNSIAARLGSTAAARAQLKNYAAYEEVILKDFSIIGSLPCGIYVPLLWRIPWLARLVQPFAEITGRLLPLLAHERVYLLQKRS